MKMLTFGLHVEIWGVLPVVFFVFKRKTTCLLPDSFTITILKFITKFNV